jgi:hypothetical protein
MLIEIGKKFIRNENINSGVTGTSNQTSSFSTVRD